MAAPTRLAPPVTRATWPESTASTTLAPRSIEAANLPHAPLFPAAPLLQGIDPDAMSALPAPDEAAQAHSRRVAAHICDEISRAGGWIPFARYMELALYAPGLGYYAAGAAKLGPEGDFVTAPEISRLFGRALARQVAQVLEGCGGAVLELGAGSGRLAEDLLQALEALDRLPEAYLILEVSPALREQQARHLARLPERLRARVRWLEALPAAFRGVVIGNEVLDALPVHLVAWREQGLFERGLAVESGAFVWRERPLSHPGLRRAAEAIPVPADYVSEISLAAPALVRTLGGLLEQGVLLFVDYGFPAAEYYHPQRASGTLMCHYRHRVHDDPFLWPGLQDITAHVDFTAAARAAREAGLEVLGYASQARFLLNCGLLELLAAVPAEDAPRYLPLATEVHKLLSPAEMGELFKVLALGRGLSAPLLGFAAGDRSHTLA
jgi:SAM-dependent MidA family methyltransferase